MPNNWAGLLVVLLTVAGSVTWIIMLFDWDNPARTQKDRDKDKLKGMLG
ncbi:MAG: hypothetical protein ACRDRO_09725 [Pseudonocardiaceae bacterium]